jgi:hypothetical protein
MRFKATATVTWEVTANTAEEAKQIANKNLEVLKNDQILLKIDKLKDKVEKIKLGEFSVEDVIPYLTKENTKKEYEYDGVKYQVKMNSDRYFLFRECMSCVACGLKGTKMILECYPADRSPHFNLYGKEEDKLILMTKDHIHAKSSGGENRHSNYQTMCLICNNLKAHFNLTLDGVRELRKIYNENKNKICKKDLHQLLENARLKLAKPLSVVQEKQKTSIDSVTVLYDINLYKNKNGICGRLVYDSEPENHDHIGCIKKGSILEPLAVIKDVVMCVLQNNDVFTINKNFVRF